MASAEISESVHLRTGIYRAGNNSFHRTDLVNKSVEHRVRCFANRNNQLPAVRLRVVKVFADPQHPALTTDMPLKRLSDVCVPQRAQEQLPGDRPHRCRQPCMIESLRHFGTYREILILQV